MRKRITITVTYYHSTDTDDPEPPSSGIDPETNQARGVAGLYIGIKLCLSYMYK